LVAVDSPDSFLSDTPTAIMVRQILGAVSQFEKASIVAKLRAARQRKRARTGKGEGRKSHSELRPATVAMAKRLHRRNPKTGGRRSYREIAAELAAGGHVNKNGRPFGPSAIKSMVEARPWPAAT
jgi:DNA invertase Pin-like site-specific DNA recombinase